jgi:hypothetical protein
MKRILSVVICIAVALTGTGCSGYSSTGGSGGMDLSGIGDGIGDAIELALIGVGVVGVTTYSIVHENHKKAVARRPKVMLEVPKKAAVNEIIEAAAAYRVKGKVVPEWWAQNPYTVTVVREVDGAPVKPDAEERRDDGKLVETFRAGEPGTYVVEIKTWASGTDTATTKPLAATRRKVKVQ